MKDKGVAAGLLRMHFRDCFSGGLGYDVPAGRRDGRASKASEATTNLPSPAFNAKQLTQSFAAKGLTQEDMVVLSRMGPIGVVTGQAGEIRANCRVINSKNA
ncbi:hypothetical protein WN944_014838 [Citrus x changshan-huyou]|uniref:peroxidase n=1 Tax=Citrus x changshan-huyou TaxID=2935761 RepID=A0AAP0MAK7_9ROSI